ncbi:MAG: RagB/SusD family nutrient uptake outer membrane protein, partial [Draconibacterium sp.]
MKYRIVVFFAIILLTQMSCLDLQLEPESSVSSESYWKVEDDAQAAANGLYVRMRGVSRWDCLYWFECRAGNIAGGMTSNNVLPFTQNNLTPNLNQMDWTPLYNIVSQANVIMEKIDQVAYVKEETRNQILAQAYFFRAWSYFQLVRLWGEV